MTTNYHTANLNQTAWNTAQLVADSSSDYHLSISAENGVKLVKAVEGNSLVYTFSNGIWTTADASSTTLHALLK